MMDFFGTCQICGRQQKAHEHTLAKHGYTIRYGWQMGECFGSGAAPYEMSNDRILVAIEHAKRYIEKTTAEIAALRANPLDEEGRVFARVSDKRYGGDETHAYVTVTVNGQQVEAMDRFGKRLFPQDVKQYTKTAAEAVQQIAAAQIARLQHSISETETAIPYMQKRYDNWKPGTLKPVSDADRAATKIKVHFEATKWGRKTGVCVASAQGSTAYKQTTTDRSKVTCAACLKELARMDEAPRLKAEKAEKDRLAGIKKATREIKDYTKLLKNATTDEDRLYWTRSLNMATDDLTKLNAAAPVATPAE